MNAGNAHQANDLASAASGVAVKSGHVVSQVVETSSKLVDQAGLHSSNAQISASRDAGCIPR